MSLQAKRRRTTDKCEVEGGCGKEGEKGNNVEKEPYLPGMWEHFSSERSKAKKFRQLADEEMQWQEESPARE